MLTRREFLLSCFLIIPYMGAKVTGVTNLDIAPFAGGASNGLCVDPVTGDVVLGNDVGAPGNPAMLLSNREIQMQAFSLKLNSGTGYTEFFNDGSIDLFDALDKGYSLTHRGIGTAFPVPTLRPVTNNSVLAFDLMPKGAPAALGGDTCWFDVCGTDIYRTNVVPVNAARVGVGPARVQFGSKAFNGAADIPVELITGNSIIGTLQNTGADLGGTNQARWNVDRFFVDKPTPGGFTGGFLFNDDAGDSAAIQFIGRTFTGLKFGFFRWECDGVVPGDPYVHPNQFEILANNGAVNGMVIGCLVNGGLIKFIQGATGATELARFSAGANFLIGSAVDNGERLQVNGAITTADPGSGVGAWRLGTVVTAASVLDATKYVEVKIGGTVVKLATIT